MIFLIEIYWATGLIIIIFCIVIHYLEVAPFLQKHGAAGLRTWITNVRPDDLGIYKELCVREERPLFWYHILSIISKYTELYLIGWFVTIFLWLFILWGK